MFLFTTQHEELVGIYASQLARHRCVDLYVHMMELRLNSRYAVTGTNHDDLYFVICDLFIDVSELVFIKEFLFLLHALRVFYTCDPLVLDG